MGIGYTVNHYVTLKWDGSVLTTTPNNVPTNSTGGFNSTTFRVPITTAGLHTVNASDLAGNFAIATFNVNMSLTLNPSFGPGNTAILVSGSGFHPNKNMTMSYDGSTIPTNPLLFTSDVTGSFQNVQIFAHEGTIGQHTVKACDSLNTCQTAIFVETAALITNFASGSQTGNLTTITPTISSNTPLLAIEQDLYFANNTLITKDPFQVPFFIQVGGQVSLQPFNTTVNTQSSFYENVTLIDGVNKYISKSQVITFSPIFFQQSNNNFGHQNFTVNNPNQVSIYYKRVDVNSTLTNLLVTYPNSFNLTCTMNFAISQQNKTFSHLSSTPIPGTSNVQSTFSFKNVINDVITIVCTDHTSGTSATYVLTQNSNGVPNFPLIQYVQNFRAGQYGTHGQIGAIDIISLICIFVAMVGLSRVNEAAGIILATIVLGFLAFFQLVQWPTVLTGAIAVIIMIAITSTKKLPWSQ